MNQDTTAPPPSESTAGQVIERYREHCWLVIAKNGWESLHRDRIAAEHYATRCHGVCEPLFRRVAEDQPPATAQAATAAKD
jgi:hypothetical protein